MGWQTECGRIYRMGCEVRWDEMGNGLGQEMGSDKRRHGMFSGVGYDAGWSGCGVGLGLAGGDGMGWQ